MSEESKASCARAHALVVVLESSELFEGYTDPEIFSACAVFSAMRIQKKTGRSLGDCLDQIAHGVCHLADAERSSS